MTPGFLAFAGTRLEKQGFRLRVATAEDLPRLAQIYASTRTEELAQVGWSDVQKKTFTDWQSAQQERHYELHYPNAERLVVGLAEPIGRIYVDTTRLEVRLMDVTLLPAHRGRGIGTCLMGELLRYADALGREASLHVEPFNPARRMYARMGFATREVRGLYEFMVRPVPGAPS